MLLQEDLVDILPAIEEANSISEDLDEKKKFELMLVSPEARGQLKGRTEVRGRIRGQLKGRTEVRGRIRGQIKVGVNINRRQR